MIFQAPADYIARCKADPIPVLPIPMVAEYLNITPAAVVGRAGRGALELFEIGKTKMVTVRSLLTLEEDKERKVATVRRELELLARKGQRRVFYEPIMSAIDLSWRVPAHRTEIGRILGVVSERTNEEDGLMLSVLVHQKKAGRTLPGPGFFGLADDLGFTWEDNHAFVEDQTDRVLEKYRT